jgi:3(or 17)beta-hydroxysteroid dehydrogenase
VYRLGGKVAVVTGGAAGLGKAIALRLVADGAQVVITDVQCDLGQETARQGQFLFVEQDVANEARWHEVVRYIEQEFGQLHILVNNAGMLGPASEASPVDTSLGSWRRVFAVNVESMLLGCRAALPLIGRSGGGSIINMSSIAAMIGTPFGTAYGASKAAVQQLTLSIAQYCAEQRLHIRCNSVHPGIVQTPLWLKRAEEIAHARLIPVQQVLDEATDRIPLGDFTMPEDVANAVAFLVSEDARHVTGSQLVIDGGMLGCGGYKQVIRRQSA